MSYVRGEDRGQAAPLPAAIEDYVAADAPVRVIDAFVDGLDVNGLGLGRSVPAATGRPPYDPRDLLKLYVYGYLNEVRSSPSSMPRSAPRWWRASSMPGRWGLARDRSRRPTMCKRPSIEFRHAKRTPHCGVLRVIGIQSGPHG